VIGDVIKKERFMLEAFNTITWSLVVAANNSQTLNNNLLKSPDIKYAKEVVIVNSPSNASKGYNDGLSDCNSDLVVFAHQDVYLPKEWSFNLFKNIENLSKFDPNWAVAGVYGVTANRDGVGYVYSTGLKRFVGEPFRDPIQVRTIDEMIIVIRRSTGLKFDEKLPCFHLYGTDICIEAEALGMRNYVLPCFALHNSRGIRYLPLSFWRAYLYLRTKWKRRLPVVTPCTSITKGCLPIFRHFGESFLKLTMQNKKLGTPVPDPSRFYAERIGPIVLNLNTN